MDRKQLTEQIFSKNTYLCVGLDSDMNKLPHHLRNEPDGLLKFNKAIIDATKKYCVSYKINTAFYEALGTKGWDIMEQTVAYIPSTHFKIADAKRGDIGNTSAQYAKAFFETLNFDAITVAPYMGEDSVRPFLEYENKWTIVLGLTSNTGSRDFEFQKIVQQTDILDEGVHTIQYNNEFLYRKVIRTVSKWTKKDNLMFVIGATQATEFAEIRAITPNHFYLVPGVGLQGGSLKDISQYGLIKDCGLLVNVSRAIIYASDKENFAEEAAEIAKQYQYEMKGYLQLIS
ncbi:MAG TPA: orotidine-5'-phosphate decarboxylase [Flavisolibacter sp.]|jgi:orotidine-5'-phosphate decarboxylase|nr:orotidine-5'-phosphate decarboxylase [Flavisolibacter sp.]